MEVVDTVVRFLNCYMLDSDYNNTLDFIDKSQQIQWFNQHTKWVNEDFDYQRKNNNLKVGYSIDELKLINYLIIDNSNGERFFYFIMDKEYVSENVTNLVLKLDLIQTYLFDIDFKECLVERQHIQELNNSTDVTQRVKLSVDEGLDTGEYRLEKTIDIYNYISNGCYIFTSSERLGISDDERINFLDSSEGGDDGGTGETGTNYLNGYADKNGMKFLKSVEGFASEPYNIGDGTNTIGYGTTEVYQATYYNQLLPSCTEQQASEVMGEIMYNFSGTIKNALDSDGYNWGHMTQGLFNACTSFAYNSGNITDFNIYNMILNESSLESIATTWETTNIMIGSEFEEGLRNRRKKEADMVRGTFDYTSLLISDVTNGGYITTNNGYGHIPTEYQ